MDPGHSLSSLLRGPSSPFRLTILFLSPFIAVLLTLLVVLVIWERTKSEEELLSGMKETARAFFGQVMVARAWNAYHGGVYAAVSDTTQPNPYLDDPERDITSREGKQYTKINPAYMTREMSEIAAVSQGYRFRVVSLNPVNPANSPDSWEKTSLESFDKKTQPETALIGLDQEGTKIFRYAKPLITDDSCLKCHMRHGYTAGDVRGAVSITIPMAQYEAFHSAKLQRTLISHIAGAVLSILFLGLITFYLARRLSSEIEKNIEREKLGAIVELAGATAHEMRQPMTILMTLQDIIKDKLSKKEQVTREEMDLIDSQCVKMDETIEKMLHITSYKTTSYVGKDRILDLGSDEKTETRTAP